MQVNQRPEDPTPRPFVGSTDSILIHMLGNLRGPGPSRLIRRFCFFFEEFVGHKIVSSYSCSAAVVDVLSVLFLGYLVILHEVQDGL